MFDIEFFKEKLERTDLFHDVMYFEETDSTNTEARKISDNTDRIIISDYQIFGKGRFERKWESERGKNLTFTLRKHISIKPEKLSNITFFFSYCVYSGIIKYVKEHFPGTNTNSFNIKWPNDIMWNDHKIGGLLMETRGFRNEFIIGIGLNVNQEVFPSEFAATSISSITGNQISRESLLLALVHEIIENYEMLENEDYDTIFKLWKNSTKMIGRTVSYSAEGSVINICKITDLRDDGSIELVKDENKSKFYSGDIKLIYIS